jgi:hypothetical protein
VEIFYYQWRIVLYSPILIIISISISIISICHGEDDGVGLLVASAAVVYHSFAAFEAATMAAQEW